MNKEQKKILFSEALRLFEPFILNEGGYNQNRLYFEEDTLDERTERPSSMGSDSGKEFNITLPYIRLSEKEFGRQGTKDRQIMESLMRKIVGKGGSLRDKILRISEFVKAEPGDAGVKGTSVSDVMTHIVFLDTFANILLHFGESSAGFTFEGFLAVLLEGEAIPPGAAGIEDVIDNDKMPISLKLLSDTGGQVDGSYKDLIEHFTTPELEDIDSPLYRKGAGAEGKMTYLVVLKTGLGKGEIQSSLRDRQKEGVLKFYQFNFNAENFLEIMKSNKHNANLLLLSNDYQSEPEESLLQEQVNPREVASISPSASQWLDTQDPDLARSWSTNRSAQGSYPKFLQFLESWDETFLEEFFAGSQGEVALVRPNDSPSAKARVVLKKEDGTQVFLKPKGLVSPGGRLKPGDPRLKGVGSIGRQGFMTYRETMTILEDLVKSGDKQGFWNALTQTQGYLQAGGETQFHIPRKFYEGKFFEQDGYGYVDQIKIGQGAIYNLAQKYSNVLQQQIFDIYENLERLSGNINSYFVEGKKDSGMSAIGEAENLRETISEYAAKEGDIEFE